MIYDKQKSIELLEKVWKEMDSIVCPRDTEGNLIEGTPELIRWNRMFFRVQNAASTLQEALDIGKEESL